MSSERYKNKQNDPLSPFEHEMNKEKTKYHSNALSKATLPEETGEAREPSQFQRGFGETMKETAKEAKDEATSSTRTLMEQISDSWNRLTSKPEDIKETSDKATNEIREQYEAAKERAGDTSIKATSAASEAIRKGQQEAINSGKKGNEYKEVVDSHLKKLPDSEKEGLLSVNAENKDQKKSITYPHEKIVPKDPFGMTPEAKSRENEDSAKVLGVSTSDLPEVKNKRGIAERSDTTAKSGISVPEKESGTKSGNRIDEGKRFESKAQSSKENAVDLSEMRKAAKEHARERGDEGKGIPDYIVDAKDYVVEKAKEGKDYLLGSDKSVQDKAKEGKDYMKEKSKEGADYASEKAKEGKDYMKEKAKEGKDYLHEKSDEGKGILTESKDYLMEKGKEAKDYLLGSDKSVQDKAKEGKDYIKEKSKKGADYASEKAKEGKDYMKEKGREGVDYASEKAQEGKDYIKEKSKKGADYASEKAKEGKDYMKEKSEEGKGILTESKDYLMEKGKEAKDYVVEKTQNLLGSAEKKGNEVYNKSKEGIQETKGKTRDYISDKSKEAQDELNKTLRREQKPYSYSHQFVYDEEPPKSYLSEKAEQVKDKGSSLLESAKRTLGGASSQVERKGEETKDYLSEKAKDVKESAKDTYQQAKGYISEKGEDIQRKGSEKLKETKEYLGDKAEQAKEKAGDSYRKAKDYATDKAEKSKEYAEDKGKEAKGYIRNKSEEIKEKAQRAYERPPEDKNWLDRTFEALKNMTPGLWWYDKSEKPDASTDFEKAREYHNQQMAKASAYQKQKEKELARERDERLGYERKKTDPAFMRKVTDYFSMEMSPGDEPIPPTEQTVGQFIKKRARST